MIIPKNGDFIKHKAAMDLAIRIDKVYVFEDKWKVKGTWYNQAFDRTFSIGTTAKFEIPERYLSNWLLCTNPKAECIRNEEWRKLK